MRMFETKMKIGGAKRFQQICEGAFAIIARTKEGGSPVKGLASRTGYTLGVAGQVITELLRARRLEVCSVENVGVVTPHYRTITQPER